MFQKLLCLLLIVSVLFFAGCAAHVHQVGSGPSMRPDIERARQWYILYGIVPLNLVNTKQMAAGAANYRITTYYGPVDALMSAILAPVTISARNVLVEK